MANWNGLILTDAGRNLQAKVEAGQTKLTLTKFKLGNGALSGQQTLEGLADLVSPKQVIGINTCTPKENGLCTITGTIVNTGLTKGYELKELGVFATDPDSGEILYAITTDTHPDYLQPEGGATVVSAEFSLNIAISNTNKVTAVIDVNGLASIGNVHMLIAEHNRAADAHGNVIDAHNADIDAHTNIIIAHNTDSTAHANGIAGNAATATKLKAARTISLNGDVAGSGQFDGSDDITIKTTVNTFGESVGHIGFTISNIPEGCLTLDTGALISRATYPQLWQFVQSSRNLLPVVTDSEWQIMEDNQTSVAAFSIGDGSTTFRLPKLLDYPRGGTVGDVGTWYGDAIRNITGRVGTDSGWMFVNSSSSGALSTAFDAQNIANQTIPNAGSYTYPGFEFNASRVVPTAAENRPKTVVGVFYIRAFHGTTNQGNIDITKLINEKADVNLSNINAVGKQTIANLGRPSNTFVSIPMPTASGQSYTAPANGYITYSCACTNQVALVDLYNTKNKMIDRRSGSNNDSQKYLNLAGFMPVKKGDVVLMQYQFISFIGLYFVYAEGEI